MIFYSFKNFSYQLLLMAFLWSLSDSKSPQVSRILLSILADVNNDVVCIVSTRPWFFRSCSPFINPSMTVPSAPITVGITIMLMFHSFFNSLARSRYFSFAFSFILGSAKSTVRQVLFFFCWPSLGLVVWPRLDDPFVFQNPRELCASPFLGRIMYIYHSFVWSSLNFLHTSKWINFQPICVSSYTLYALKRNRLINWC